MKKHLAYIIVNEIQQTLWWKIVHPLFLDHVKTDGTGPEDHFDVPEHVLERPGFYVVKTNVQDNHLYDLLTHSDVEFEKSWPPNDTPDDCGLCKKARVMNSPPIVRPYPGGESDAPICDSCYTDVGISYFERLSHEPEDIPEDP